MAALLAGCAGGDGGASLATGDRNPLARARPVTTTVSPVPASVAPTAPPTTLPPPTPMILGPGPAPAIARVDTPDPVIFLGIDDGLTRDPAVLDYLEKHRLPFVAFLNASPLESDPAYWTRARAIGGTIQAHTLTHPNLTKVSADQMRREICGSADLIQRVTGTRPTLFRPPYGAYNDTVRAIAAECGFVALAMWKGTTNDGRVDLQEPALRAGDILLLHWRGDLLTNLQQVVALARTQGLRVARLEDYLQPLP